MGKATTKQSNPKGTGKPITDLLINDLIERREFGTSKYGEPLKAFNGRDPLIDAYQELIDLLVYIRQHMEESNADESTILLRMLKQAAEDAWFSEIVETDMVSSTIGEGNEYADREDWIESWLTSLREKVLGLS